MFLPLSRNLPLRDSTAWGRFASIQTIPRIYGRATVAPVPYNDSGRLFVVADHPVQGVESVVADNVPVTAHRLYHQADTTGKTVAFLELQTPITIGTTKLASTVLGMMHPVTGLLMTNPADVAKDLLQWATGSMITDFAVFASECQRAGAEVHGALTSQTITIRATLDNIMDSACTAWSTGYVDFGMLWPVLVQLNGLSTENGSDITTESGDIING